MLLYRSIHISSPIDMYYELSNAPSIRIGTPRDSQINEGRSSIDAFRAMQVYYTYSSAIASKALANVRDALSLQDLWAPSTNPCTDDDLNESLKRQKLQWIDAFYSLLHQLFESTESQSFHVLGADLFVSACFSRTDNDTVTCTISGVTKDLYGKLVSYGANPKLVTPEMDEASQHLPVFRTMSAGNIVFCFGKRAVFSAAAAIVESVSPPLRTTKQYQHVPTLISSVPFVNCTMRVLEWRDLSKNRESVPTSSQGHKPNKTFQYIVSGFIFPHVAAALSRAISELCMGTLRSDLAPLYVPVHEQDRLTEPMTSEPAPSAPPPTKKLKSAFNIVSYRKADETQQSVVEVSKEDSYVDSNSSARLRCVIEDVTACFHYTYGLVSLLQIYFTLNGINDDSLHRFKLAEQSESIEGELISEVVVCLRSGEVTEQRMAVPSVRLQETFDDSSRLVVLEDLRK